MLAQPPTHTKICARTHTHTHARTHKHKHKHKRKGKRKRRHKHEQQTHKTHKTVEDTRATLILIDQSKPIASQPR